jgi:hypothetical protein
MSVRVTVYAEGGGETPLGFDDSPSWQLGDDDLGAGHVLTRRAIALARNVPEASVVFRGRFRDEDGAHLTGSDLLDGERRHRLATLHALFPDRLDLVVILIDRDGDPRRTVATLSEGWTGSRCVVGVAREEFEAWLISDASAVAARLGQAPPADPEAEAPSACKSWLQAHVATLARDARGARDLRTDLARQLHLATSSRAAPSLARFLQELSPPA